MPFGVNNISLDSAVAQDVEGNQYIYSGGKWKITKLRKDFPQQGITLYDLNKAMLMNCPIAEENEMAELRHELINFFNDIVDTYAILVCNDLRYYTLLKKDDGCEEGVQKVIIECIELGLGAKVITWSKDEDTDIFEIWVRKDNEMYCVIFADYSEGVIKCY